MEGQQKSVENAKSANADFAENQNANVSTSTEKKSSLSKSSNGSTKYEKLFVGIYCCLLVFSPFRVRNIFLWHFLQIFPTKLLFRFSIRRITDYIFFK